MLTLYDILAGGILPAAIAAAVLFVGWRFSRQALGARDSRSAFGPLAVGLGFAGGWFALFGRGAFPPIDSGDWLLYWMLPLVVVGTIVACREVHPLLRVWLYLLVTPPAFWLLSRPLLRADSPDFGWWTLALVSALTIAWVVALDEWTVHASARRVLAMWLLAIIPASFALVFAGSQRLLQMTGLLAGGLLGSLAMHLVLGRSGTARGLPIVVGVIYGGALLYGTLYLEPGVGHLNALLLFAAPALPSIVRPWARHLGDKRTLALQAALVAVAVGIPTVLLAIHFATANRDLY